MPKFTVVVERTGTVTVEAANGLEAMRKANFMCGEEIDWNPEFEATDYIEEEE